MSRTATIVWIAVSLSAVPLSVYAFIRDIWGGSSKILTALLLPGVILFSFGIALGLRLGIFPWGMLALYPVLY